MRRNIDYPRLSEAGFTWSLPMPRIHDAFLSSVIFIYPSEKSLKDGKGGGAGFLYGVQSEYKTSGYHPYLVTNRHVIEQVNGDKVYVQINKRDGTSAPLESNKSDWVYHHAGDDLAILQIKALPRENFEYDLVKDSFSIDDEFIDEFDIGAGDEVFMVGRFTAIDQAKTKQKVTSSNPVVRFGNIALNGLLPVWNEATGKYQESHLVEMRSIHAFSGSPVMASIQPFDVRLKDKFEEISENDLLSLQRLLGITWGPIHSAVDGWDANDKKKKIKVGLPSSVTGVIPDRRNYEIRQLILAAIFGGLVVLALALTFGIGR